MIPSIVQKCIKRGGDNPRVPLPLVPPSPKPEVSLSQHIADKNDPHRTLELLSTNLKSFVTGGAYDPERKVLSLLHADTEVGTIDVSALLVSIDQGLSEPGAAADAKATGNALAAEAKRAKDAEEALGEALTKKVDAVAGKGLSSNDFTNKEKEKLGGLPNDAVGGYKLVEVGEDGLLLDRASNHATEERNARVIWKPNGGESIIPSDRITIDAPAGIIEYEAYGVKSMFYFSNSDETDTVIPDGNYFFQGQRWAKEGEITLTPLNMFLESSSGSWTGKATWADPTSGEERTAQITNGDFNYDYYSGECIVEVMGATVSGFYAIGTATNQIPKVGDVVNVTEAWNENNEDILSTLKVVISSVTVSSAQGNMDARVSIPEHGVSAVDYAEWNLDDKAIIIYAASSEYKPLTSHWLSFYDLIFPLSGMPVVNEVYKNTADGMVMLEADLAKSSKVEFITPEPAPDRLRDFIVVFDAQNDGLKVEMSGVKEADEDVLKMEKGRNAIFVTEFVQGEMYATRKLLEAPSS